MLVGLCYKPPIVIPHFADEIAQHAMTVITPLLQEHKVTIAKGRGLYVAIFKAVGGDERYDT